MPWCRVDDTTDMPKSKSGRSGSRGVGGVGRLWRWGGLGIALGSAVALVGCSGSSDGEPGGDASEDEGNTGGGGRAGASGGAGSGSGGDGSVGACGRSVSACTAPEVRVSEIDVGTPVTPYGRQGDADKLPMAIAALPNGGSRLAWLGTDSKVYVAELDCDDRLVGEPLSFPAVDLQDIHADADGGVILITREAEGSGAHNCGSGQLCGGESSPCYNMFLVRFDREGNEVWAQPVTNAVDGRDGYQNGARFVWWYQHHGRLAFDGENYAAYFGTAITTPGSRSECVDIHQGDRMQVVSAAGELVRHQDAFEVGCSHSWQTRIVWDPRSERFVMTCVTDNNCRIARPNPYRTVAQGECNGTLLGGDLVLSSDQGYWVAWSQDGKIRLDHFTEAASNKSIADAGSARHPHLVNYGEKNMLLTWASGAAQAAQVRDAGSGEPVGEQFTIEVPDHAFQAFKPYADGSVAYPAAGSANTKIRVARVLPCE